MRIADISAGSVLRNRTIDRIIVILEQTATYVKILDVSNGPGPIVYSWEYKKMHFFDVDMDRWWIVL